MNVATTPRYNRCLRIAIASPTVINTMRATRRDRLE